MSDEKTALLPQDLEDQRSEPPQDAQPAGLSALELILLSLGFLLGLVQSLTLYFFYYASTKPSCLDAFSPHFQQFAQGLPSAITLNLPTVVAFLIAAPYLASENKVGFAKCLALFCYLLGSTWGALMLGREMAVGSGDTRT